MATLNELKTALFNADKAGDYDAARKLASAIGQMQSTASNIPESPESPREYQAPQEEPTLGEKAVGALETAATLATGATGGAIGQIGGTIAGMAENIAGGTFGTQQGAELVKRRAEQGAAAMTLAPKSSTGQSYTEAAAEFLAPMAALMPATAELGAIGQAARNVSQAAKPIAKAVTQKIIPKKDVISGINLTGGQKGSYAVDKQYGTKISSKVDEIGGEFSLQGRDDILDTLISKTQSKTLTDDDYGQLSTAIFNSAKKHDIDPTVLTAQILHETGNLKNAKGNNFGGITWNEKMGLDKRGRPRPASEGGYYVKSASIAEGVEKQAQTLAKFKTFKGEKLIPETLDEQALQAAKELGIDVATSDVFKPTTYVGKAFQTTGERIYGVGTGAARATQQEQRVAAIENVAKSFNADSPILNTELAVMEDLAKKRGDSIIKYAKMKQDVFAKMKYNEVPVSNTTTLIDNELVRLKGLKTEGVAPLINVLQDYKTAFSGQKIENIETLRKQLGDQLKAPDMTSVSSEAQKVARNIYRALNDDIGNFVKNNGERRDFDKWSIANKQLFNMNNELESRALKATLKNGKATPETITRMLYSKKPSELKLLYSNLTEEGRQNARAAILGKAYQDAIGKDGKVITAKFATNLQKMDTNFNIFFKGQNREALRGLQKALSLTQRAEESPVMAHTGEQLYLPALFTSLGAATGGGLGGLFAAGAIGLIARVYESAPIRNALISLDRAKTSSAKTNAIKSLSKVIKNKEKK